MYAGPVEPDARPAVGYKDEETGTRLNTNDLSGHELIGQIVIRYVESQPYPYLGSQLYDYTALLPQYQSVLFPRNLMI